MASKGPDLPLNFTTFAYLIAAIVVATLSIAKLFLRSSLDAIPVVGSNSWLGSWRDGFMFPTNGMDIIRKGYKKYKYRPFRVADHYRWLVIISSREHMDELQKAADDQFSFAEAVRDRMSADYTIGKEVNVNHYHIPVIRSHLNRDIGVLSPTIRDEIVTAFEEILDLKDNEWKCVPALSTVQKIVFRTSNRVLVGLPLCRNPDWMDFNMQNALNVINGGNLLQHFPAFLAPFISLFITNIHHSVKHGMKYLAPIIEERRQLLDEHENEWDDKPTDFISQLIDAAEGEERTTKLLTARVLSLNFATTHNIAQSFTHALFYLAGNPQYIQPLREEAEAIVAQEGWTKMALGKMHKIDSFLRENQRLKGNGGESLARKALKDFTFSDGTFIPKGTMISAPAHCLHLDDNIYENAATFDPFRFARMREADGEGTKYQIVSTSLDYLPFGHGRNACPGRFLAAHQLKTMLAHIVLMYDVKLEENATIPESIHVATAITVNPSVKVMFRRRY